MGIRPNFTDVQITGDDVRVEGVSDEVLPVDIRVYLEQAGRTENAPATIGGESVDKLTTVWHADIPAAGFTKGPALALGIETRTQPLMTITWSELVDIR